MTAGLGDTTAQVRRPIAAAPRRTPFSIIWNADVSRMHLGPFCQKAVSDIKANVAHIAAVDMKKNTTLAMTKTTITKKIVLRIGTAGTKTTVTTMRRHCQGIVAGRSMRTLEIHIGVPATGGTEADRRVGPTGDKPRRPLSGLV
ncbi:hypothetical protein SCUP234_10242 [Seiridium cupressi]